MRNTEEGKVGVDFTLGIGSPNPDLSGAVSYAWVYLRRLCCRKYSQTQ